MKREEILQRLATGAAYLERTDLSPQQREKGMARYAELEEELKRHDREEEERRNSIDPAVLAEMNKIREILGMQKR
jgi:hypothetical protein